MQIDAIFALQIVAQLEYIKIIPEKVGGVWFCLVGWLVGCGPVYPLFLACFGIAARLRVHKTRIPCVRPFNNATN